MRVLVISMFLGLLATTGTTQAILVKNGVTTLFEDGFESATDPTPYSYSDPLNTTDSDPDGPAAGTWTVDEYDQKGVQVTSWTGPGADEGDNFVALSRRPYNAFMAAEFAPQSAGTIHAEMMVYIPTLLDDGNGNADDYALGIGLGRVSQTGDDMRECGFYIFTKSVTSAQLRYLSSDGSWHTLYNDSGLPLYYTPDQWCRWTVQYDLDAGTWVLAIDGVSTLPMTEAYDSPVSCLAFKCGANRGTAYIDSASGIGGPERHCGDAETVYLPMDISGPDGVSDCYVNLDDLEVLARNWLLCSDPADPNNCTPWLWLGNDLGKEDIVPPPWTPITITGADTINIWGRTYTFNDIGLPSSLMTIGVDLLAESARFVTVVNGSPTTFIAAQPLVITHSDSKTIVEANSTAGSLQLNVITTVEFDGFARVDLTLTDTAGTATLDKFWLEFPLDQDSALFRLPLYVQDPTIPAQGVKLPILGGKQPDFSTTMMNWVGGDDRGLNLLAENDRNWCSADRDEAQELDTSVTGQVIWRYHFVDNTITRSMTTPLEITYCFMATPVKPVENWYAERNCGDCGVGTSPFQAASTGIKHGHVHEPWTEIMGYPGTLERVDAIKAHIKAFSEQGVTVCLYSHPVISSIAPEYQEWIALWSEDFPPAVNVTRDSPPQDIYFVHQIESWADFYIYNWVRMIEKWGARGVYLDGTFFPGWSTSSNYEDAYVVGNEVRPTRTIFAAREFMKRWYIACKTADPDFYFQGHLSGGDYIMPTVAFLDFSMGGEQMGVGGAPDELSWGFLRAAQTGRQFGIVRELYTTATFQEPYLLPLGLLHGINIWGRGCGGSLVEHWQRPTWDMWENFGINDATWVPYWHNSALVSSSHADVKVSYHVKPHQVLLVAATNKRTKPSATVTVDLTGLGLDPGNITGSFGTGGPVNLAPYISGSTLSLPYPAMLDNGGRSNYLWIRSDL